MKTPVTAPDPEVKPQPEGAESSVPPIPAPVKIGLADLDRICRKTFNVVLTVRGQRVALEARALTPEEDNRLADIINAVVPPSKLLDGKHIYDTADSDFRNLQQEANLKMQCVGLSLALPSARDLIGDAIDRGPDAIYAAMKTKLDSEMILQLFAQVRSANQTDFEAVDFTFGASSPQS